MENNEKKPSQINFDYNGKHYCLEYTRETVRMMEAAGFNPYDINEKPALRLEQMWAGAFMANHRNKVSDYVINDLFDKMKNRSELFHTLQQMIAETYNSLMPDEEEADTGNVEWTAM